MAVPACLPDLSSLTDGKVRGGAGTGSGGGAPSSGASGTAGNGGDGAESGRPMGEGGADAGASGEAGAGDDSGAGGAAGMAGVASMAGAAPTKGGAGAGTGGKTGGGGNAPVGGEAGSGGAVPCDGPGKALLCGAATWVGVPRSVQDDFTIEAWIKTSTSRVGQWFWHGTPLVWGDSSAVGSMDFAFMILNGKLVANIGEPDSSTFGAVDVLGRWVHVAMTRTRVTGAVQLLVNGVVDGTGWGNVAALNSTPSVSLGSTPVRDLYFEGLMDEVRFWNVVRTEAQLRASMHTVLQGNEPGLVAYYRFDALTGTRVLDSSVHGSHGDLVGSSPSASSSAPVCAASQGGAAGEGGAASQGGAAGEGGAAGAEAR